VAQPTRTCIGCGEKKPKGALVRLVLDDGGQPLLDRSQRQKGRGAYLCGAGCLKSALKRKAFGRAFRGKAALDPAQVEAALVALVDKTS
jgi:predicted RNA-binding protein YlxR (DUF448 family)